MSEESSRAADDIRKALIGKWKRLKGESCAEAYPEALEFRERGLYSGTSDESDPSSSHPVWDVGTYDIVDGRRVTISTMTDAVITYSFELSGGRLSFRDESGCQIEYRRINPGDDEPA